MALFCAFNWIFTLPFLSHYLTLNGVHAHTSEDAPEEWDFWPLFGIVKPVLHIVVTITEYASDDPPKRVSKLPTYRLQIFLVKYECLRSLQLCEDQDKRGKLKKRVRKHVLAILTTYIETRLKMKGSQIFRGLALWTPPGLCPEPTGGKTTYPSESHEYCQF